MAATRDGYGDALLELAGNEKVVVLEADLGKSANPSLQESTSRTNSFLWNWGAEHAACSSRSSIQWLHTVC